jgi:hypothetical protein
MLLMVNLPDWHFYFGFNRSWRSSCSASLGIGDVGVSPFD